MQSIAIYNIDERQWTKTTEDKGESKKMSGFGKTAIAIFVISLAIIVGSYENTGHFGFMGLVIMFFTLPALAVSMILWAIYYNLELKKLGVKHKPRKCRSRISDDDEIDIRKGRIYGDGAGVYGE